MFRDLLFLIVFSALVLIIILHNVYYGIILKRRRGKKDDDCVRVIRCKYCRHYVDEGVFSFCRYHQLSAQNGPAGRADGRVLISQDDYCSNAGLKEQKDEEVKEDHRTAQRKDYPF